MKRDLMEILCCPVCKGDLELRVDVEKDEILEGSLFCKHCNHRSEIKDGVPSRSASGPHHGRFHRGGRCDPLLRHAAVVDLRPSMGPDGRGHRVRNRLGGPHDEHGQFKQARVQRLQMKSACARTTPALSWACAYASSGSRFKAKNCPPQVNFDRIARASSGRPKMTSAAANASTDDRTNGFP